MRNVYIKNPQEKKYVVAGGIFLSAQLTSHLKKTPTHKPPQPRKKGRGQLKAKSFEQQPVGSDHQRNI